MYRTTLILTQQWEKSTVPHQIKVQIKSDKRKGKYPVPYINAHGQIDIYNGDWKNKKKFG